MTTVDSAFPAVFPVRLTLFCRLRHSLVTIIKADKHVDDDDDDANADDTMSTLPRPQAAPSMCMQMTIDFTINVRKRLAEESGAVCLRCV